MDTIAIAGCILAGGLGQRLGGVDKGLVSLTGRPLIAHVVARFAPQVGSLAISANRNAGAYRGYAPRVLRDADSTLRAGPLAGIAAALAWCPAPLLAIVPCDSPFLPEDLVASLAAAHHGARADIAVARTADGLQPMFALIDRGLFTSLTRWLATGQRRVDAWYRQHVVVEVDCDAQRAALANVNTPDDLAAAAQRLATAR